MDMITIKNAHLTVIISPVGAEIQSVIDEKGRERMWQGDESVWSGRAPILFPVGGGMRDDYYIWQGKKYSMQKHGFVRRKLWQVESVKEQEATFLMTEKTEGFPFDYELRAVYTLEENTLQVSYRVKNTQAEPFYFSIGAHEAYLLPGGIEEYAVHFDEEERLDRYVIEGKGVTIRGGDGRSIRVEAPEHPVTMFWTKPNMHAPYLCIEPWCNAPDRVDAPYEIDKKFGFMRLEGGEEKVRLHRITFA